MNDLNDLEVLELPWILPKVKEPLIYNCFVIAEFLSDRNTVR